MKIVSIVGTRPNFMKITPLVHALRGHSVGHVHVHIGRHYDHDMSEAYFDELQLPKPDVNLGVGSGSSAYQIGQTMIEFEKTLVAYKQDWVVVVGDVNATATCSDVAQVHDGFQKAPAQFPPISAPALSDGHTAERIARCTLQ